MTEPSATDLQEFHWFNEPDSFTLTSDTLSLRTRPDTDFWQRTHYGFRRDNGHCLLKPVSGNFTLQTKTEFTPTGQYDQCGLVVRVDSDNWIKCSCEFETPELSRLGCVVTNLGFSDWSSQDITTPLNSRWFRVTREDQDFIIEQSADGNHWEQLRVTHLHAAPEMLEAGLYACSPTGTGFDSSFTNTALDQ